MSFLKIRNITKRFGNDSIVNELDVTLDKHKTLSILGRSGCGKTTMLKMIAGLLKPDSGEILLDDKNIENLGPSKRSIVYLYQEDLLFPHLNVFENIAFGLRIKKMEKDQITDRVEKMIDQLELSGHGQKMPNQISGGQRQRVSFGRAIITNPSLLLLDEPFGSLDAGTRKSMQSLFKSLAETYTITSMFVTHDLKEAILMGDEIAYMEKGNLRVYKDLQKFIEDPITGVNSEVDFWKGLSPKMKMI